jgi:hypothetical protein
MSDYTPGHALIDISLSLDGPVPESLGETLARLYKAGQANERAAIIALLHAEAEDAKAKRYWDFVDAFQRSAAVIERAS